MAVLSEKSQEIIKTSPIKAVYGQSIMLDCGLEIFLSNDEIDAVNQLCDGIQIKKIEHENHGGC